MATLPQSMGGASAPSNVVSIVTPEKALLTRLRLAHSVRMIDRWMDDVAKAGIRGEIDGNCSLRFNSLGWAARHRLEQEEVA